MSEKPSGRKAAREDVLPGGVITKGGHRKLAQLTKRLEAALRRQHAQMHGSHCECRAFEVEAVIAERVHRAQ